ncbi:MAG: carboxypeptidase-like regulatory domain-containing protein [Arcicella sp.]|nr:carboxypeptidase-like regulatory domain-containing protein [Arcicella sp.]
MINIRIINLLIFCVVVFAHQSIFAQYVISGRITDAKNGDPLPFATVGLKGANIMNVGAQTNFEGIYTIKTKFKADSIYVSTVNYKKKSKVLDKTAVTQTIDFQLQAEAKSLDEVVVYSGENPAFKILRKLRENADKNDRKRLTAFEYDSYSKMELDVDNISEKFKKKKIMKQIQGAIEKFEKIAGEDGKAVIPTFISETISKFYYRESPARKKEMVLKNNIKGVGVKEGSFVSQLVGGNIFANYDFYDNFVPFLGKDIISPTGNNWKGTYSWYIADTTNVDGHICYGMEFDPKNNKDLVFEGKAFIDTTSFALVQIDASIGKQANINFIDKIKISQEMEQTPEGAWLPSKTRFLIDVAEISKSSAGMLLKMYISNKNFVINKPKELSFYDLPIEVAEDSKETDPKYWLEARHESLSAQDILAEKLIDTIRNVPIVKTYVEIAEIIASGYKRFNKFAIGPYINLFAVNAEEGLRTRFGFKTLSNFDKKLILKGWLGFGTKDLILKYGGEVDYILSRRHWTMVGIKHSYDIERLSLTPEAIGDNKIFYAFTRWGNFSGPFYRRESEVFLKTEPTKGISFNVALTTRNFDPLFNFQFRTQPELGIKSPTLDGYDDSFITVEARFAKGETYLMDGNERVSLGARRIPVITLTYQHGMKGVLGSNFNYNKFTAKIYQSFRLGNLGRSDYTIQAGYIPSDLPAPLLFPHLGNQTFFYNRAAFNTMHFFEFVSDKFVSLNYNHNFEGLLFNRIPLIRQLKWRLIASANVLFGSQRESNLELMKEAVPVINPREMGNRSRPRYNFSALNPDIPYIEVGYGIDNIFKIFRIQAFHRLTYLDHEAPGGALPKSFALKASVHFSF